VSGFQIVGVQWKCSCGHTQLSQVTTVPYLLDGEIQQTHTVNCMECYKQAEVNLIANVFQTDTYDSEEDFE
jgi:N-acetylglucosamine-6-phosphate deacetylase